MAVTYKKGVEYILPEAYEAFENLKLSDRQIIDLYANCSGYYDNGCEKCPLRIEEFEEKYGSCSLIAEYGLLTLAEKLLSENAVLRERLEKAVELPAKIGDTVYKVYDKCDGHDCPYNGDYGQWRCHYEGERRCKPFIKIKQFCYSDIPFVNKTVFVSREAAEARLKQMQGGEK